MIGMLRGKVWEVQGERLILDVHGVGYALTVPLGLLGKMRPEQEVVLYTHLIPREDELTLFGFGSAAERNLFLQMQTVSGIGPKAAISLLSALGVSQLQTAIAAESVGTLTKVPGIGKKTAQRIVLELKEKFKELVSESDGEVGVPAGPTVRSDALDSLLALGFSLPEARQALKAVEGNEGDLSTEEQIKRALRYLAGH